MKQQELHRQGNTLYTLKHGGYRKGEGYLINGTTITVSGDDAEKIASIILRAVNNYDALVKLCKELLESHGNCSYTSEEEKQSEPHIIEAYRIIAAAEEA